MAYSIHRRTHTDTFNFLTNPLCSYLYDLSKSTGHTGFSFGYLKGTSKDGVHCFQIDVSSFGKISDNIFIPQQSCAGSLEFKFNERDRSIYITKLPYYSIGNNKVGIFTGPICNQIVDTLKRFFLYDADINLIISDPAALILEDSNTIVYFPSYSETQNHNTFLSIVTGVENDKARLIRAQESYASHQRHEEMALERAQRKKAKLGLLPDDFATPEEYMQALTERQKGNWLKQQKQIERHLSATEEKYLEKMAEFISDHEDCFYDFLEDIDRNNLKAALKQKLDSSTEDLADFFNSCTLEIRNWREEAKAEGDHLGSYLSLLCALARGYDTNEATCLAKFENIDEGSEDYERLWDLINLLRAVYSFKK